MASGEVFLDAFVSLLLDNLASTSGELLSLLRPAGIDVQLKKCRDTLLMIGAVLNDAQNKQTSHRAVKEWLNNLEDLAYDLDDLVDELNTEVALRKLRENREASSSKVRKLIHTCFTKLSFADLTLGRRIASKLRDINDRLEDLAQQINILSLVNNVMGRSEKTGHRLQLTSVVEESEVHGRDKEKEDILNMLLGVESSDGLPMSVIPILGMGGVGKTTLVQLVYNDCRLKDEFDLKAWVCISNEFDAFRVTKIILESASSERCDNDDFNMLQVKLKETLSNKRFLVVLDDVWNENYGDWDILCRPFLGGKPGSKIIVTTRHERVAKIMSDIQSYHLAVLSESDALSLLAQHSLRAKTFDVRPDLREIGKSVVKRCQNLPLAVKALGGLLRTIDSPKDWEDVLNSEIWTTEEKSVVLPALKLSYQYLSPQLKRCFSYCAIFHKNYEFEKSELVCLWVAEGFVQESQELGSKYFDELLARSFLQQSSANGSSFVMHDLHNDLAMFVAGDKCMRMEYDVVKENLPGKISEKVRHLSIIRHTDEYYYKCNFLNKVQSLRTFLSLPIQKKICIKISHPKEFCLTYGQICTG